MATKCQNLLVYRKTSKNLELTFKENGVAKDITDWTIYFTVKEHMEDEDDDALIKKDITTHTSPTTGTTLIELDPTDTDHTGSYYYDIKYKTDDGDIGGILRGRITFEDSVTLRD